MFIHRLIAGYSKSKIASQKANALKHQGDIFNKLVKCISKTSYGKSIGIHKEASLEYFRKKIPIQNYEKIKPEIEKILQGKKNVLWKGKPLYFCKTSGTTSGIKYIPIFKSTMPYHIDSAKNALFNYAIQTNNWEIFSGKMIFVQGNPKLNKEKGIKIGRLSGIVAHYVPSYLQRNRLPSFETNCIENWEEKIDKIIEETESQNMTVIAGIPPWLVMYFERLVEKHKKPVGEIFPNLKLIIAGGVNFKPYEKVFDKLLKIKVDFLELYPASEGFFAFQDDFSQKGMLLETNSGMFYEFVNYKDYTENSNSNRITLDQVKENTDYVIIISTYSGLFSYVIGDLVKFTSLSPYRVVVSGRVEHFTSAFGEHVIADEVEYAMHQAQQNINCKVREFTIAPQINPETDGELPYHEWFIEFDEEPEDLTSFANILDKYMVQKNIYYKDLISGKILQPLKVIKIQKEGFQNMMKDMGKLGEQNKPPRLKNDRSIAQLLTKYTLK